MKYVLGIDAAWTLTEPSGVALIALKENGDMELIKIARSYHEFYKEQVCWSENVAGSKLDFAHLSDYCKNKFWPIDVVALDIPLSPLPITSRRGADKDISSAFGGRGASTHSPSSERPGPVPKDLYEQLTANGYTWNGGGKNNHSFIEVYPHTAIIELFNYKYRLPYKVQNRNRYWPNENSEKRLSNIVTNLNQLKQNLAELSPNINEKLHTLDPEKKYTERYLKGYEDILDAVICAVTGCFYIQGKIKDYGDPVSRIWVPDNSLR